MKSIKLIWLADRLHLRNHGRTITGDVYFALKHGPVPSTTRDILELNSFSLDEDELQYSSEYISITGQYNYESKAQLEKKVFSQTDIEALEAIYSAYGNLDHFALRDVSHGFPEWKKYESALQRRISSRFPMNFIDFFEEAPPEFDLVEVDQEAKKISKEIFIESSEIANYLK